MTTHVIILAQGQQKRLPDLETPKQMLELPACGGIAIIERTLCQLALIEPTAMVTIVCGGPMMILLPMVGTELVQKATGVRLSIGTHQLGDPGNSSLKGIARYLENLRTGYEAPRFEGITFTKTVVLLGDVIYSWPCLRACMEPTHWGVGFVGTSDLSRSGGELWGLSWMPDDHSTMKDALGRALKKHPPFEDYQPGQMRRWLWEIDELNNYFSVRAPERFWFTAIDDYTRDIDLPEHIAELGRLSEAAALDDATNGLVWNKER